MNRHVTTEQLSAYLDRELGIAERRQIEAHLEACPACGAQLASLRRVLNGLGRVQRTAPPPVIAQQLRRQLVGEAATPAPPFRRLLFLISDLARRQSLQSSLAMALTLVLCVSLVSHGVIGNQAEAQEKNFVVKTYAGAPLWLPQTKSEVAGREFVLTEEGWVQEGLEWEQPRALVDTQSPEGQALLTKYENLEVLLAEGDPVVLRDNLETVELRNPRVMGFEAEPPFRAADVRLLST
jgi:anti-sigma factor RsiW